MNSQPDIAPPNPHPPGSAKHAKWERDTADAREAYALAIRPPREADDPTPGGFNEDDWAGLDETAASTEAGESATPADPAAQAVRLPNLPDEFWAARERFAVIRRAAWHAGCGADMVFLGVLCRLSGMRSHLLTFDLGQGEGSLNLFGGAVGGTGLGKSRANSAARKILLRPAYLALPDGEADEAKFKDGIGIGTGEGMAEAYMGMVDEPTGEVAKRATKYANAGDPIMKSVRRQVRHNAYFYLDEGEHLTKTMVERSGTTIGPAIRTAWIGGSLGQQNAKDETTRFIDEGTYSMGMAIGYQPSTVQTLLADGAAGTPQRFAWLSGWDPSFPLERPDVVKPFHLPIARPDGRPVVGIIKGPQWLADQLWEQRHAVVTGDVDVVEKNSHETLMRCKFAALLALMGERMEVVDEDWQLAGVLWDTSSAIRDQLTEIGRQEAQKVARQRSDAAAEAALSSHAKVREYDAAVQRVARLIAKKVYAAGSSTPRGPKRELESRDRALYDVALACALQAEWLVLDERVLASGPSRPA